MNGILNIVIILTLGIIISSCEPKHNLTVKIKELGNDTIFVKYVPVSQFYEKNNLTDTIVSINNKFTCNSPIDEPVLTFISFNKARFKRIDGSFYQPSQKDLILLIKPNEKIVVSGILNDYFLDYEAKGSSFNQNYSKLRSEYINEMSEAVKIELQLDTFFSQGVDRESIMKIGNFRNELICLATKKELEFIKCNSDNELSAYLLARPRQRFDTIRNYFELHKNLSLEIQNGIFKEFLISQLERHKKDLKVKAADKNIVVGNIAPDFILQSLSGSEFSLNLIKDKIIVLDFWGSWCGWCIKGFPKMREYYEKYQGNLEIVGINCRDSKENWKKFVEENELNWEHVINSKDKDVSVLYGVKGYPTKIILDKDKKIIAKFRGESEEFYNKLDEVMNN